MMSVLTGNGAGRVLDACTPCITLDGCALETLERGADIEELAARQPDALCRPEQILVADEEGSDTIEALWLLDPLS